MTLSREVIAAIHLACFKKLLVAEDTGQNTRWYTYRRRLSPLYYSDAEWIRRRRGSPSDPLSKRIAECHRKGWPIHEGVYVRPSMHPDGSHGSVVSVGSGLFSLLPFKRGHLLFQFTGRVVPFTKSYIPKNKKRQDYCIECRYGPSDFVVNPLTKDDTEVHPDHFSAFINEPSAPPWRPGDSARHGRRNVIVRSYDHVDGTYAVEYAQGRSDPAVPAVELSPHPMHPLNGKPSFEANTFWYDFPVPLDGLYTAHSSGEDLPQDCYSFSRTSDRSVSITWDVENFFKEFTSFSNSTGIYRLERKGETLVRGNMVYMRDRVFLGLERYGVVQKRDSTSITVLHAVSSDTLWRLPLTVLAGKAERCAACGLKDDPGCTRCKFVPFPLVFCCKDISPGDELLCLYERKIKSRGLPCQEPLQDRDMLPRWNDH